MAFLDCQEVPDMSNLYMLATVACIELEKQQRSASKKKKKNKRTASLAAVTAVTNLAEPPLKKLKEEFAELIFSAGTDQKAVTLIKKKKEKKIKKKKVVRERDYNPIAKPGPPPLREAPASLKQKVAEMNGTEAILVAEKPLTSSDLNRNLGRLQIPESQMNKFLSDEESSYLMTKEGNKLNGIEASLHQYSGDGEYLGFKGVMVKRWPMVKRNGSPPSIMCVLTTGWNGVVAQNKLNAGDMVQVWSFRVMDELHLALLLL